MSNNRTANILLGCITFLLACILCVLFFGKDSISERGVALGDSATQWMWPALVIFTLLPPLCLAIAFSVFVIKSAFGWFRDIPRNEELNELEKTLYKTTERKEFLKECQRRLNEEKKRVSQERDYYKRELSQQDASPHGDKTDQTQKVLAEGITLTRVDEFQKRLKAVKDALSRIKRELSGQVTTEEDKYGICEETSEPIDRKRLLHTPWTRLSLEGAEIRENENRRKMCGF